MSIKNRKSKERYLNEIIEKHGDIYDYSLVEYTMCKNKIKIICKTHGIFEQRADRHLSGSGCIKCKRKVNINKTHKQCYNCKLDKERIEFSILNRSVDKLSNTCKTCLYNRINKWKKENVESVRNIKKKWKKNNKVAIRAYERNRRKTDKNFQLKANMRGRLNASFKKFEINSSIRYLDYSIQELKGHLESKFTKGMSWDNYGKDGWEVDHIIPIICFDINGDHECEAFKKCWALENLQPLWKTNKIAMLYGEDSSYIGNCQKQNKSLGVVSY